MVQRPNDAAADGLVTVTEQMQLQLLGFRSDQICSSSVRMTCDKWLSIVQQDQVTVISTGGQELRSLQLAGLTCAQISPVRDVIALSTDAKIYTVCLKSNQILAWNRFPCEVLFWSWVSRSIIALIGRECIYHWLIDTDSLSFVTNISPRLRNTHITKYQVDRYQGWHVVQTIHCDQELRGRQVHDDSYCQQSASPSERRVPLTSACPAAVTGLAQVHSTAHEHSTVFEAEASAVIAYKFPSNSYVSQVLVVISKTTATSAKVSVVELGPQKPDRNLLISRSESFHWSDPDDVAADIVCSADSALIHVLSKKGLLFIFTLDTCCPLVLNKRISRDTVFSAVPVKETGAILVCVSSGQILSITMHRPSQQLNSDHSELTIDADEHRTRLPEQVTRL